MDYREDGMGGHEPGGSRLLEIYQFSLKQWNLKLNRIHHHGK